MGMKIFSDKVTPVNKSCKTLFENKLSQYKTIIGIIAIAGGVYMLMLV